MILIQFNGLAQKVYTVPYASGADAILFETKIKWEADILIHKIGYSSQVNPEKGLWLDVRYRSDADWIVSWSNSRSKSSCIVYFVPYRSQGKRNSCYLDSKSRK